MSIKCKAAVGTRRPKDPVHLLLHQNTRQPLHKALNVPSHAVKLLKIVTKRVANKKIHEIFDGVPRTDGYNVWLPITTPAYSFDEKVGIASHEAAHIRFKTVFGTKIHELVCPENPLIGHAVLNILEDARIETLLKETYYGFWMDLDKANVRQVQANLQRFSADGKEILHSQRTVDLCLHLMSAHSTGHAELLYSDALRDASGGFKYAAEPLGAFWREYIAASEYLHEELTFPATVISSKRVINALKNLLEKLDAEKDRETFNEPRGNEKDQQGRDLRDQAVHEDPRLVANGGPELSISPRGKNEPSNPEDARRLQFPRPPGTRESPSGSKSYDSNGKRQSRALANQVITMTLVESGIGIDDVEKRDRKVIGEMMKKLKAAGDNAEKLQKALKSLVKKEAKRLDDIIKAPGRDEPEPDDTIEANVTVSDDEGANDSEAVIVDSIDDVVRLREFNSIEDPLKEYSTIVRDNGYTIKQLRKMLERIKINPLMQRGARRGILCDRDLPRVVSSKGKFNRPFKTNFEKRGASLLILIDESASMSVDDGFKFFENDEGDWCCPKASRCIVYKECPDRDSCNFSGAWPKDSLVECRMMDVCSMTSSASNSENACGVEHNNSCLPIYIAKKSAIILAEALKGTCIDFGVIGFSAIAGRNIIVEKIYKRLDEAPDPRKLGSIWVSFESGENRDGTSFKAIAARYLKALQKRLPVMIIISDGEPHHGGTEYVGEVAETMTAKAIQFLKQGIKLFAISIDQKGRDYLKDIYGSANYIVLDDPRDITNKLIYLVKNLAAALC
ncbi:MAG: hypothetical protein Q6373_008970 [Candidatus Sigynarchaeota archaeon]